MRGGRFSAGWCNGAQAQERVSNNEKQRALTGLNYAPMANCGCLLFKGGYELGHFTHAVGDAQRFIPRYVRSPFQRVVLWCTNQACSKASGVLQHSPLSHSFGSILLALAKLNAHPEECLTAFRDPARA